MRLTRLHVEAALAVGGRIVLPESVAGHLLRVLRAGVGDTCVLFNGDGRDYDARIVAIGKRTAEVDIVAARALDNESPLRITLLQALARGDKMDWILQKATELGVVALVPVESERSEVKLDGERAGKRVAHWHSVIIAACEQSGRAKVPEMASPCPLVLALQALPPASKRLLLDPDAAHGLGVCGNDGANLEQVLAIGPEGGWSPRDLDALRAAGFIGIRLGRRVLRTETAGIAAIAALQARFGDFG
ncbi:MAG TPA: 16S rRNA (uracil(1498)-N(3))-methyltransferase [Luteimonas sp.]|nr:16S rRNA (uracil(1498)-N(3))-methyltransferase [Luteimonas sp.]